MLWGVSCVGGKLWRTALQKEAVDRCVYVCVGVAAGPGPWALMGKCALFVWAGAGGRVVQTWAAGAGGEGDCVVGCQ